MTPNFFYAEVVEPLRSNDKRFQQTGDTVTNNLISVIPISHRSNNRIDDVKPFNKYNIYIPTLGEIVLIITGPGEDTDTLSTPFQYFYISAANIFNNQNINPVPGTYWFDSQLANSRTEKFNVKFGDTFKENTKISSLQPYEGDIIFTGRNGSAIRFSTSYDSGQYTKKPAWQGTNAKPITIISTGLEEAGSDTVVTEDFEKTKSLIVLSSDQRLISFKSSQRNLGTTSGVQPSSLYQGAQIVLTSDRLVFNSKKDEIILSSQKTVTVATPSWAMDMDKLFTVIEKLVNLLTQQASANSQYQFQTVNGPTNGAPGLVPELTQLLTQINTMRQ
jgi:hypothetical protein